MALAWTCVRIRIILWVQKLQDSQVTKFCAQIHLSIAIIVCCQLLRVLHTSRIARQLEKCNITQIISLGLRQVME
jgi:hypothetical protein